MAGALLGSALPPLGDIPVGWRVGDFHLDLPAGFGATPYTAEEARAETATATDECVKLIRRARAEMPVHGEAGGVTTCIVREEDSPYLLVRGQTTVQDEGHFERAPTFFAMPEWALNQRMRLVDPMFIDGREVATLCGRVAGLDRFANVAAPPQLPSAVVRWSGFHSGAAPLVSNRDFLYMHYVDSMTVDGLDYVVALARSVERPDCTPAGHTFVRARLLESGYVVQRLPDHRCRWTFVIRVDAGGYLPAWVQNLVAPKQAMNVGRLRTASLCRVAGMKLLSRAAADGAEATGDVMTTAFVHGHRVDSAHSLSIPFALPADAAGALLRFQVAAVHAGDGGVELSLHTDGTCKLAFTLGGAEVERGQVAHGHVQVGAGDTGALRISRSSTAGAVVAFRVALVAPDGTLADVLPVTEPVLPLPAPPAAVRPSGGGGAGAGAATAS